MNNAAQMWYFAVWEHLEYLCSKHLSLDYGVFTWHNENNELYGIFRSQNDDFLWAGNDEFKSNIEKFCEKFQVAKRSVQAFKYVGLTYKCQCCLRIETIDWFLYEGITGI